MSQFLSNLLQQQALSETELQALRSLRDKIEGQLRVFEGEPRFYYGGSYGKDTIIRASYDLDVVMYWPHSRTYTLSDIFSSVGTELRKHWQTVQQKNVAWSLPFNGGFHVDVVPGKAIDPTFEYANLWRSETAQPLQTSIKRHISNVRKSGRRDVIRLLKLWKIRKQVPVKSFVLEILAIEGAKGASFEDLGAQLQAALTFTRDNIHSKRIIDPANSNNDLAASMTTTDKVATYHAADAAVRARTWNEVF
jgi:hypothetical protein